METVLCLEYNYYEMSSAKGYGIRPKCLFTVRVRRCLNDGHILSSSLDNHFRTEFSGRCGQAAVIKRFRRNYVNE